MVIAHKCIMVAGGIQTVCLGKCIYFDMNLKMFCIYTSCIYIFYFLYYSNLNGMFSKQFRSTGQCIFWDNWKPLKLVTMMIRPKAV